MNGSPFNNMRIILKEIYSFEVHLPMVTESSFEFVYESIRVSL